MPTTRITSTASASTAHALQLETVARVFGALAAVADVTLDVKAGERRAILGANGAGKTTLFDLITGDVAPTSGTIRFFGEDVTALKPHARIRRSIETQKIHREITLQKLETERRTSQEISEQQRAIAVAEHSRLQSVAQAAAETARAEAVSAEEQVFTTREVAVADRRKRIELITASQEAERSSTMMLIEAKAQKEAATERAEASRLTATGEADADKIRSLAAKIRHEIEAEGARLANEAQNVLSPESRNSMLRQLLIERLEGIVRESVKPMERIGEIKIMQVDGMMGGGGGNGAEHGYGQNLSDQVVNSALRYRAQGPMIDKLLKELGIPGGSMQSLMGADLTRLAGITGETAAEPPRRITVTPPEAADEGK